MGHLHHVAALVALLQAARSAHADSPSPDEFPYWPTSVRWSPKPLFKTCSPIDSATPHGPSTWTPAFTSCVYTLAYFDTCSDDACVDAFDAATTKALNCSYDGKVGTAQEVEANRFQRCVAARRVEKDRYVPEFSPSAPRCSSEKLAGWNANYTSSQDYTSCLKSLTTTTGSRTCSEYCRRVFHDAVSDADECLFSDRAGSVTHHEWFKYLLVWCIDARGETLRADPLLYTKGTTSPAPTTPKPTTPAPTTAPPLTSSSGSRDVETRKPTKKPKKNDTSASSSGSRNVDLSDGSSRPIDLGSSQDENTHVPVVKPPAPGKPQYGNTNAAAAVPLPVALMLAVSSVAYLT